MSEQGFSASVSHLQRCCFQLTQRLVILENIILKEFGSRVFTDGEAIIAMLDRNFDHVKTLHLCSPYEEVQVPPIEDRLPSVGTSITPMIYAEMKDEHPETVTFILKEEEEDEEILPDYWEDRLPASPGTPEFEVQSTDQLNSMSSSGEGKEVLLLPPRSEGDGTRQQKTKGHTRTRGRQCQICGIYFQSRKGFSNHAQLHRLDGKYKCEHCKEGFRTEFLKKRHIALIHARIQDRPYKCNRCPMAFATKHRRQIHAIVHSTPIESTGTFDCHLCSKKFKWRKGLNSHYTIHSKFKPYCCPKCDGKFSSTRRVKTHLRGTHGVSDFSPWVPFKKNPEFLDEMKKIVPWKKWRADEKEQDDDENGSDS